MRHERPTTTGDRSSALWGRGGRETRNSALWGRGGRSTVALFALVVSVIIPAAGIASSGKDAAIVPADLLAAAKANPGATFNVIIQGERGRSSRDIADRVANESAKAKKAYRSIIGVSATLNGAQLVKLAGDSHIASITRDERLKTDYVDSEMWREAVSATELYAKDAVTCATSALTGLQLDLSCVPSPAVVAPQAPAIAIVDSGIDASRVADFGSRVIARANLSSLEPDAAGDPSGHGTMVAGIAAGAAAGHRGVAPNAPLVDVRVASSQGEALTSDIVAGVDWILANKDTYNIRVANFSLGGNTASSVLFDPLDRAVEKLWLAGVVVVASAGNHGGDGAVPIGAPANDPFVITVGALDIAGTADRSDDRRAPWSAYGTTADGFSKPELSAPGRFMVMPVSAGSYTASVKPERVFADGYMWMSGTSFAAPVVAGAAAQLLARRPGFSPDQVKGALMASATSLSSVGTGIGAVDVKAAAAIESPPNPNEGLRAFVSEGSFDSVAWADHVSTQSNWTLSNWTLSNWTQSNWTQSNWTLSNWTQSNWTLSNWTLSNWTQSNWVD